MEVGKVGEGAVWKTYIQVRAPHHECEPVSCKHGIIRKDLEKRNKLA